MKNNKSFKTTITLIFSIIIAAAVFSGCSPAAAPEPAPEPVPDPVVIAPEPEPAPEPPPPPTRLPLSGKIVADDDPLIHLRPLAVKIENTPESRPALGITQADVVYETITEGGITRFNAIFQSVMPDDVGSVRSARNSDVTIVPQYDSLFVFSGTNSLVWADLGRAGNIAFLEEGTAGKALYRINYKAAPHNLYLNTAKIYDRFTEKWHYTVQPWPKGFEFSEDLDKTGFTDANDAIEIFVPYSGRLFDVTWTYDADTGRYMRFIGGVPQCDEGFDKAQIYADNLVFLSIPYVPAPDVPGKGQTYNLNFNGTGNAIVFRDGVRIDGTWTASEGHPPELKDLSGNQILYKPGKTWFQVPRDITAIKVTTGHPEIDNPSTTEGDTTTAAEDAAAEQAYKEASAQDVNE